MQPTTKPFFQATAVLEKKVGNIWKFVGNTTITNVSFQEFGSVFGSAEAELNPGNLNFAGRQGNSQPDQKSIFNLEFDYFDTPNGQIAPDFDRLDGNDLRRAHDAGRLDRA